MDKLRQLLDAVDEQLVALLARRAQLVRQIGTYKRTHQLPLIDNHRWQQVLSARLEQAQKLNLSTKLISQLYTLIHQHSLEIEREERQS